MTDAPPTWPKGPPHNAREPACARCGYPVNGLPSFTCPECGADLRQVGITTPSRPQIWKARGRFVWDVTAGMLRALHAVLRLGPPVRTVTTSVRVDATGRIVFDPPVRFPSGQRRAVIVFREGEEG